MLMGSAFSAPVYAAGFNLGAGLSRICQYGSQYLGIQTGCLLENVYQTIDYYANSWQGLLKDYGNTLLEDNLHASVAGLDSFLQNDFGVNISQVNSTLRRVNNFLWSAPDQAFNAIDNMTTNLSYHAAKGLLQGIANAAKNGFKRPAPPAAASHSIQVSPTNAIQAVGTGGQYLQKLTRRNLEIGSLASPIIPYIIQRTISNTAQLAKQTTNGNEIVTQSEKAVLRASGIRVAPSTSGGPPKFQPAPGGNPVIAYVSQTNRISSALLKDSRNAVSTREVAQVIAHGIAQSLASQAAGTALLIRELRTLAQQNVYTAYQLNMQYQQLLKNSDKNVAKAQQAVQRYLNVAGEQAHALQNNYDHAGIIITNITGGTPILGNALIAQYQEYLRQCLSGSCDPQPFTVSSFLSPPVTVSGTGGLH